MLDEILISLAATFGPLIALLIIGSIFGTLAQKRHLADLEQREARLGAFLLTNCSRIDGQRGELVTGSTVVAYDFFRRIAVLLRKLIGGRFHMHEGFMMRARREAVLRMAESAQALGATSVHNVRLVSSNLGDSSRGTGGCEVVAYGTAIWD
ncbi:YbjQ family protein [Algimonas porphyrae]|uniref:Metal-binding protein n=1 Tax=Algimonas porphyrae TaxID=1128113 RepID=A0ABQ5V1Y3_9PROT|nr:heavy metal-binding domain-containing protein [Algimonas porphyrae]GLQ21070.1 metal-binding protein [Algimonas porphyrae]